MLAGRMAARRIVEPTETCVLTVDGDAITARVGEPVAVALAAAGRLVLGRSVKYHRPRGAACYAGRCDGCLMRVDGLSSVMTCTVPARDGMVVETQNVVGSARMDLLAATDWFFPKGMDHHHMFTWSKPVNEMMQKVARRIAGIGRLPDAIVAAMPSAERAVDVLVVGGGPTGLAAAAEAARGGASVLLADEDASLGGHLGYLPGCVEDEHREEHDATALAMHLASDAREAGVELARAHAAIGVYDAANSERGAVPGAPQRTVVLLAERGLVLCRPSRLIVATGAHEGSADVPGNDIPGVLGVRAAARLVAHGVLPGERLALIGSGHWVRALEEVCEDNEVVVIGPFAVDAVRRVRGRPEVHGLEIADGEGERKVECDAVAVATPSSGAYEIGAQAGVELRFDGEGFFLVARAGDGATNVEWVRAVGQCAGVRALPDGLRMARAAGQAIASEIAASSEGGRA